MSFELLLCNLFQVFFVLIAIAVANNIDRNAHIISQINVSRKKPQYLLNFYSKKGQFFN